MKLAALVWINVTMVLEVMEVIDVMEGIELNGGYDGDADGDGDYDGVGLRAGRSLGLKDLDCEFLISEDCMFCILNYALFRDCSWIIGLF